MIAVKAIDTIDRTIEKRQRLGHELTLSLAFLGSCLFER